MPIGTLWPAHAVKERRARAARNLVNGAMGWEKNGPPKWPIVDHNCEKSLTRDDALVRDDEVEQVLLAVVHSGNLGDSRRTCCRLNASVCIQADDTQVARARRGSNLGPHRVGRGAYRHGQTARRKKRSGSQSEKYLFHNEGF